MPALPTSPSHFAATPQPHVSRGPQRGKKHDSLAITERVSYTPQKRDRLPSSLVDLKSLNASLLARAAGPFQHGASLESAREDHKGTG